MCKKKQYQNSNDEKKLQHQDNNIETETISPEVIVQNKWEKNLNTINCKTKLMKIS